MTTHLHESDSAQPAPGLRPAPGFVFAVAGIMLTTVVLAGFRSPPSPTSRADAPRESAALVIEPAPASTPDAQPVVVGPDREPAPPARTVWFDGRRVTPVRTIRMRVTAYSPDERSCAPWADGRTASGYSVWTNGGHLVAADPRLLPIGTLVSVPGYDDERPVPVLDVGGAIKGRRLDVLFPTHRQARRWGVRELEVTVWEDAE